ncbi:unnamed protein product (macronuclear) [Paramecium tetraurelia]|uniref:CHHC U11-48K-type domain-containing protein n=1 Tax=Paramecium tetraurelia TaxID=5888 RepID=A0DF58_PARTE|nr:uncharacterized protein GSPATT00016488001 [Paramecium tetraurelia]CAK81675.1 unnamed protein product [Paramecium tetraurelia]|eukprot:XP_001449072.1 hypothetical protein (macronuclear) [Paramecium tetraurelia strain d4-2]
MQLKLKSYELEYFDEILEKKVYLCPINKSHSLKSVDQFIQHLHTCKESANYQVKKYICRFNQFHWFNTAKDRIVHEFFYCEDKETVMPQNEVIINQMNEVFLPLNEDHSFQLKQYFKKGNSQARPNFRNFISEFQRRDPEKESSVKRIKLNQ